MLKLIYLADSKLEDEEKVPTRVDYVERREIDRSTLYSFNGPFQLIHGDIGNLKILRKNATVPRYVLVVADLYSSKVYAYSMLSNKQVLQKMKSIYDKMKNKRKKKKTIRLQVDNEF